MNSGIQQIAFWAKREKYRPDIDGLRAVAILAVVLFHAFPQWVRGGFIGVDVFFVISGYLISSIIFKGLEQGTFSFGEFYARRIVRIFPALIIVLAAVLVFGWFSLLEVEYKQVSRYVVAGALFFSNLLAWHETGYFDVSANLKPLLHLWSLGLEEQFYLIWPLALMLFYRRSHKFLTLVIVVALLSFLSNILLVRVVPVAAFYSPTSRFFELMAGAVIAHRPMLLGAVVGTKNKELMENALSVVGVLMIVAGLVLIDARSQFPGFWVLLPIVGTMCLIQAGSAAWVNRYILNTRPLVYIGLISYPLYLWHWPLLSFASIVEGGFPSREIRIICVFVAITLAWLTFRFIELPIRNRCYQSAMRITGRVWVIGLIMAMTILCMVGGAFYLKESWHKQTDAEKVYTSYSHEQDISHSKRVTCGAFFPSFARCYSATTLPESEKLLVIGDSHGGALAPGIYRAIQEVNPSVSVIIVARPGGCPPLRGVESYNQFSVSHECKDDYEATYRWAMMDPSVKTVILVSRWARLVGNATGFGRIEGNLPSGRFGYVENGIHIQNNSEIFTHALRNTLTDLTRAGKRVVFVHQVPEFGFSPPFCERRPILLNSWQDKGTRCTLERGVVEKRQQEYRKLFDEVRSQFPVLQVVDSMPIFCDEKQCSLKQGSTYLYRDDDHLNDAGADLFGKNIVNKLYGTHTVKTD